MTAKRFTTDYKDFLKEDMTFIKNNDKRMTFQEVVDLLNELHEENQQLKHDLEIYEENNTNEVLNQLRIELTSRVNDCIEEFKE